MAIEDITMLRVLIGDLEKRIGVLEKRIGSLEKFGNDGGVGFKSRMEAVDYRLDVFDSKVDSLENRFKAHVVFGN